MFQGGIGGAMSNGLFAHGIQNEDSDIRAHVGVRARTVFVFRTEEARRLVEGRDQASGRFAGQSGVNGPTAFGFPVALSEFHDLRRIEYPGCCFWAGWTNDLDTSRKGRRAVYVVTSLLSQGRFPLWIACAESKDRAVQIAGTDIVVCCKQRIQVKCDYNAGDAPGCTGNIYLQTAERNPLKLR
jgi:hypothetical protein